MQYYALLATNALDAHQWTDSQTGQHRKGRWRLREALIPAEEKSPHLNGIEPRFLDDPTVD